MKENRFFPKVATGLMPRQDRTAWLKGNGARCEMPPRKPLGKAWHLVMLGAPGVGKGVQAELLSERLACCHLSTGDIFRTAKCSNEKNQSPAIQDAVRHMKHGDLVPDETVLQLVRERLDCLHCSGGFLLDGFPRTLAQAVALDELLKREGIELTAVLDYELPLDKIVRRLSGRRVCANCRASFHTETLRPRVDGVCDHCGGTLVQREDDRPEAVGVRIKAYQANAAPLIEFYRKRGLLITINAEGTPEEVYRRTRLLALGR
jgi:adenylate kinase